MSVKDKLFEEFIDEDDELTEDDLLVIEEELLNITADCVDSLDSDFFLERLFVLKAGEWLEVSAVMPSSSDLLTQVVEIETRLDDKLIATWLDYPNASEGYCLILFFMADLIWTNSAMYNKQLFLNEHTKNRV